MVQSHIANFAPDRTVSAESLRLVELLPCAALLYSDDEAILAANGMFCGLLGYTPAGLARLSLADLTAGEDRQRGDDARVQLLHNVAGELSFQQRYRRKDGEVITCEVALKCIADAEPVQYLAVVRQLSIQHPREAGQLASDEELIVKSVAEGFVVLDREFRVLRINDEALRIDGRPRSAFLGRTHWEIWPGSENLPLADAYRRAMRDRVEVTAEQLYRHNGRDLWIKARATPLRDGLLVFYRNITGRKRAEEELRESEARFRTIADTMPQIVWSTQPDGYHDYFNRQWYEYTGVPEGAAHGDAWVNLFHPDDVARMEQRWGHSLATGEPYEVEFRLRHRSGEYRWWLARALPVRNEQGEIVRWMGTSTDIHERILMQAELQDIQVRLQAALNAAEIGTWTWDIAADQVHADSNLAAMLGVSPAVADGGPIAAYYAVIHPDDVGVVRAGIDKALASGEPYFEQFRVPDGAGRMRYMLGRGVVLSDAQGGPRQMSGAVLDVTRQQQAESALKSSELTFRTLADNIPQLAWMADADGNIFWYNNRWFAYTGTTLQEMQGWGWAKVHHPEHVDRVVALYRKRIVEDQETWEDTFPLRGADGHYRWFLSRAVPIRDEEGHVLRWMGTNTDITLQREAEEALQQSNQRKDDFLAMLAHELRGPLAPISTAAQLLKLGARNPENIQRSSDIIDRQVKHMSELVDDLMDASRVTRGLVSIEKEVVSVSLVVHTAIEQSRPLIEARKQELVLDMSEDGGTVLGDRTRLIQVLTNLLNNAAKYTPQGGRIVLKVTAHDTVVDICISDNGIGMDASLLPHVFELFTQAERTPDRSQGGLGLGLALVKSIVALHNGRITAESAGPGMGSTFTVTLPLHAAPPGARPLRILLVDLADDDEAIFSKALQADGHTVILCRDGACARAEASEHHPDAVLVRADQPCVAVYALARQLRALHPDQHAVYIALTESGQSHDKIIARGAGFDYHLERPVSMSTLRRILPSAYGGESGAA